MRMPVAPSSCAILKSRSKAAFCSANASNFVHLSGAGHDFAEKHRVQSRRFAFARDAVFSRMLLEQAERQLAHQREIRRPVPVLNPARIFPETHIQLPMQVILNSPMT